MWTKGVILECIAGGSLLCLIELTRLSLDKMAAISQTMFSNVFSRMKNFVSRLKCHRSWFRGVQLTITQHWFKWLSTEWATSHYLNQWWLVCRRIYAAIGGDELTFVVISGVIQSPYVTLESTHNKNNFERKLKFKITPFHKHNKGCNMIMSWKENMIINTAVHSQEANFNSSRPNDTYMHQLFRFKRILLNENIWISNRNSLKYIPWGLIDDISVLV